MIRSLILLLLGTVSTALSADVNIPVEIQTAIAEALQGKWVGGLFDKNKQSMGFDSLVELTDIIPGEPFQLNIISQSTFQAAADDAPIDSLIEPGVWYVPLYVDGELMQTVMVIRNRPGSEGRGTAGADALKPLAQAWMQIKKNWPEKKGYHPKLVLIQEWLENNLYLFIPEKGQHNLTIIGNLYIGFKPAENKQYSQLNTSQITIRSLKNWLSYQDRISDSIWTEKQRVNDSLGNIREVATQYLWKEREMRENENPYIPDSSVTSWWGNLLVAADEAVIPGNKSKEELQHYKQTKSVQSSSLLNQSDIEIDSEIIKSAQPLRIEGKPIDRTIAHGEDHWYILHAIDGPGFIRMGATGSLSIVEAPYKEGQKWGPGGAISSYDGPEQNADILEIAPVSPTHLAIRWRVPTAFMRIRTEDKRPVAYRISFVAELPEKRIGGLYGPGVAARGYILAVASGDTAEVYRITRTRFSFQQVSDLRKKLFGSTKTIDISIEHQKPGGLEVNAEGKLHVQHYIGSAKTPEGGHEGWAFEIICIQKDGLWLVADAYRDPELSDKDIAEIVKGDLDRIRK